MTHQATNVAGVEDPTNGFGQTITGVDDSRNFEKIEVTRFLPVLECKILNVDMSRTLGRSVSVSHFDS
jgi:hypothetical protein